MLKGLTIGLVISGGNAVGAYHAGALKAFSEIVPKQNVKIVSASSIGGLNAYAYVTGKTKELESFWKNIPTNGLWSMFRALRKDQLLMKYIKELIEDKDVLDTCFYLSTSEPKKPLVDYWHLQGPFQKEWRDLFYQATSFPFLVPKRITDGKTRMDGGLFDNIPVYPFFYEKKPDMIVILHSDPKYRPPESLLSEDTILFDYVVNLGLCSLIDHYKFDRGKVCRWFDEGYEYAKNVFARIFFAESKEELKGNVMRYYRENLLARKKNYSADSIATMCNNVFWNLFSEINN